MTSQLNRREFLQLLGAGVATVAAPAIVLADSGVVVLKPKALGFTTWELMRERRRFWQVGRNAPVGGPVVVSGDVTTEGSWYVSLHTADPGDLAIEKHFPFGVDELKRHMAEGSRGPERPTSPVRFGMPPPSDKTMEGFVRHMAEELGDFEGFAEYVTRLDAQFHGLSGAVTIIGTDDD